ncbi:Leucine carboxyl methyltransferase 1 [Trichoplax sp. H2]|nr:Leucine carboxyl methyltransferase 1 [Trichoplax sp. H2]|eukprot:RDD43931.1 Leucine carboxyl methyltransferase 1 [Trichoplax sp. H2]
MSDDQAVRATNDDATMCKSFAVQLGYWKDRFVNLMSRNRSRKTPEINRGYYARVKAVGDLLRMFLKTTANNCQVISLGAGFDTNFWNLQEEDNLPLNYIEVDFAEVTAAKCAYIKARKPLHQALSKDSEIGNDAVRSKNYNLIPCDLRYINILEQRLNEIGIDYSLPTICITECVLVYMAPDKSEEIINWMGRRFLDAVFINYEPVNLNDRFGEVMLQNLRARGCELKGVAACPTLQSQTERYYNAGWTYAYALLMSEVYQLLPREEIERIEKIEFLDETDLLVQLLKHYCLSWAIKDSTGLGLKELRL